VSSGSNRKKDAVRGRIDRLDRREQPDQLRTPDAGTSVREVLSDRPERRPDVDASSFWSQVPYHERLWQRHLDRWPEARGHEWPEIRDTWGRADRQPDRTGDQPGSWRGSGDRYLNPEANAEAEREIGLLRRPEQAVTELLKQIERANPHGGVLAGLNHRLKGTDRLKEKLVDKMAVKPGASMADAAGMIGDAVRYTFCFSGEEYVAGYVHVQRQLEAAGCRLSDPRDHWLTNAQYKGLNTSWNTPDGGRFELQVHTPESFYANHQLTHPAYVRLRSPDTSWQEMRALEAYQRQVSAAVPCPCCIAEIYDHREGAR